MLHGRGMVYNIRMAKNKLIRNLYRIMPKFIRHLLWKAKYLISLQNRKINIEIPKNFSFANVYFSLVPLNHPHVQRPQHLAIESALDESVLTIYVHVNSSSHAEIFHFENSN